MTNQVRGEVLYKGWAGDALPSGADTWVYTPWMPVAGDLATFGVEVLVLMSGVTLKWAVETRTRASATVTEIIAAQNPVATGTSLATNSTAAQELVRYRLSTGSTASTTDFTVIRALAPSWQVNR